MTVLPVPRPYPVLTDDELKDLLAGVPAGRYTTRDLWPRYEAWATERGRAMVSRNALGMVLRRVLGAPVGYGHGHVALFEYAGS